MRLIITAGPTREYLDPVRFLSNPSTGRMGFALASEAVRRGFETTLVAGPVQLRTPRGVKRVDVVSAREMMEAVRRELRSVRKGEEAIFVATAAVADWRPAIRATRKLKKTEMTGLLRMVRNPDILKSVKGVRKVGFAAETDDVVREAARKCREKKLEFVVANDVLARGAGFGVATNRVTFVFPSGETRALPLMSKRLVAARILDELER